MGEPDQQTVNTCEASAAVIGFVCYTTNLTPYVSTREPLKYALTIPPKAEDPQHSDWRDPDVLCDSPRALSTTMESTTCKVFSYI
jgi:hypothetical protein